MNFTLFILSHHPYPPYHMAFQNWPVVVRMRVCCSSDALNPTGSTTKGSKTSTLVPLLVL
jgi:hypothetical protein